MKRKKAVKKNRKEQPFGATAFYIMKAHPIIFSSEMVRAILDGRKTQTRRIIKPQPFRDEGEKQWVYRYPSRKKECLHFPDATAALKDLCPYGQVGDRLWVRESHQIKGTWPPYAAGRYLADKTIFEGKRLTDAEWKKFSKRKRKYARTSGRFMYKSLARIFLEITNIRVERLQEISLRDLRKEGLPGHAYGIDFTYQLAKYVETEDFKKLWDSLNAKRGYGWDKNNWVWVIEFNKL